MDDGGYCCADKDPAVLSHVLSTKFCKLCEQGGQKVRLNEVHVLLQCPVLEPIRVVAGISEFHDNRTGHSMATIFKAFWNVKTITLGTFRERAGSACMVREAFLEVIS